MAQSTTGRSMASLKAPRFSLGKTDAALGMGLVAPVLICLMTLVVSTLFPKGPDKTLNMVEFYYPEEIAAFEREFVEAEQAAYWETCKEDDEIGERMDAGRRALMERGDDEVGPYQSPMEDGMQHFHEWYRGVMGAHLKD